LTFLVACSPAGNAEEAYAEGQAALDRKDPRAAIAAFERAGAIAPNETRTWLKLGIARAAIQDWPGSIEAYDRLLDLDPDNPQALNNMANVYFRQGRYEESATYYERAIEAKPDYLTAMNHYGWVLRQLNRPDEAERLFNRCLSVPAEANRQRQIQRDCRFYVGALRFRAEDYTAAAAAMEQVLREFPAHAEARYYLAMAYRGLGRLEEARQQLDLHGRMLRSTRSQEPIRKQPAP